jgi:hypothetical protein
MFDAFGKDLLGAWPFKISVWRRAGLEMFIDFCEQERQPRALFGGILTTISIHLTFFET